MTINIIEETDPQFDFEYKELARQVIPFTLKEESFPYEAEVTLTLTDNPSIHQLNLQARGIDRATDVLSFPMVDYDAAADYSMLQDHLMDYLNPDTDEVMLGDIVLSAEKVKSQAEEYGHSPRREYAFLITHSMLHLLGYDHMTDTERSVMEDRQRNILDQLGIVR